MVFVPEGQHDSSQARSAWVVMQRGPVPEGRSKSLSVPEIICRRNGAHAASETPGTPVEDSASDDVRADFGCNEWFLQPRSVQSSRWDGAILLMIPGTSCPATIVLSLREKIHSTAEALLDRAKEHRLEAYATLLSGVSSDLWKCFLTGVPRTPGVHATVYCLVLARRYPVYR
jgi:hypothetical protein